MVVGCSSINFDELRKHLGSPESVLGYTLSLVPTWAKGIKGIEDNQRYFIALHIRKMLSIPYNKRKELTDALVNKICITGISSTVTSITDIVEHCDKEILADLLRSELEKNDYYRT